MPSGVVSAEYWAWSIGEPRGVVRGDVLDRLQRVAAGDFDLAHVADVEQPGARAHRHVLVGDAGVFDRHVPAAELDHPRAERAMSRVERGLLESARNSLSHQGFFVTPHRVAAMGTEHETVSQPRTSVTYSIA